MLELGAASFYSGTVVSDDEVFAGRYRVAIDADGSWSIRYRQPQAAIGARSLLRSFAGEGAEVIPVTSSEDLSPIVSARNSGDSNFVVELVAIGEAVTGRELLFNEIGPFEGQTLTDVPAGDYLLAVQAAGPWTVRFQR